MILLTLVVVDKNGNTGKIYEYITTTMTAKIISLERCLGVKFFVNGGWNPEVLRFKCGMGTIKTNVSTDPKYPDKSGIGTFIPMEVIKCMADAKEFAAAHMGETAEERPHVTSNKHSPTVHKQSQDLDDDIPF